MTYEAWRDDIFGQPPGRDPITEELSRRTYDTPEEVAFDYIDRVLTDQRVHDLYSIDQISFGLSCIYNNSCDDLAFCYTQTGDDDRRVTGIRNLNQLYSNYFARYCTTPVRDIGNDRCGNIGQVCYMFWDVFVLCPGNASKTMVDAGLDVMKYGMSLHNDNCIVSAIHGLGHWVFDAPQAKHILQSWLRQPTTQNSVVIDYAKCARTGCIQ